MEIMRDQEKRIEKETIMGIDETLDIYFPIQTSLIKQKKKFDTLFKGFTKLKAISYVVTPDVLLNLFDKGYETIEIVVGENLTDSYKKQLAKKPSDVTEKLEKLVEEGKLRIYISKRQIHTKLYILENNEKIRAIQSSANLTETARKARQINYCWYIDFPSPFYSPQLKQITQDYEAHKKECTLFMDDLVKLIRQNEREKKERIIEIWLQSRIKSEEGELRKIFNNVTESALGLNESDQLNPMISISLDSSSIHQKQVKNALNNFNLHDINTGISIDRADYLNHEKHVIPLTRVDLENNKVVIGLNGNVISRTNSQIDKIEINNYLEHLENYIQTVNLGTAPNPLATKMNMYEALLYIFSTPFFNHYMAVKREKVGAIDLRGPRFLYIYGRSHNGKTTFLRFALKLLSGHPILPLKGNELDRNRIFTAATKGTCFPLIFDDVPQNKWRKGCSMEEVCKNYWERQWGKNTVFPQIILSSNEYKLPEWAQSRIKRIEFDVLFNKNIKNQQKLNELISKDNSLFTYFSSIYIKYLKKNEVISEDELYLARKVMRDLYLLAERPIPKYFPNEPVEKIFDAGRIKWKKLVYRIQKAEMKKEKTTLHIIFENDMKSNEIKQYLSCLPQNIKYEQTGNLIVIENPKDFFHWLNEDQVTSSVITRIKYALRLKKKETVNQ